MTGTLKLMVAAASFVIAVPAAHAQCYSTGYVHAFGSMPSPGKLGSPGGCGVSTQAQGQQDDWRQPAAQQPAPAQSGAGRPGGGTAGR